MISEQEENRAEHHYESSSSLGLKQHRNQPYALHLYYTPQEMMDNKK